MSKHTPTPWEVRKNIPGSISDEVSGIFGSDGTCVADNEPYYPNAVSPEDQAFIVRAVNSFEAMREALEPFAAEPIGENLSCHYGITTMQECARCSRIINAKRALNQKDVP